MSTSSCPTIAVAYRSGPKPSASARAAFVPCRAWSIRPPSTIRKKPSVSSPSHSRAAVVIVAALSLGIGASAAGARTYTATSSQGLLFMAEAVYNAAGLGLPIVMTIGNRAIGAPINIWNDHSDSMSQRDCGWLQLFAEDNQQAVDLHVQAFRIAELFALPIEDIFTSPTR